MFFHEWVSSTRTWQVGDSRAPRATEAGCIGSLRYEQGDDVYYAAGHRGSIALGW